LTYTVSALGGERDAHAVIKVSAIGAVRAFNDPDKETIFDLLGGGSVSHGCRTDFVPMTLMPDRRHCAGFGGFLSAGTLASRRYAFLHSQVSTLGREPLSG
jgi:hypothetical protein